MISKQLANIKHKIKHNAELIVRQFALRVWTDAQTFAPKETGNLMRSIVKQIDISDDNYIVEIVATAHYAYRQHEYELRHLSEVDNEVIMGNKMYNRALSLGYQPQNKPSQYYDRYKNAYSWLRVNGYLDSITEKRAIPFIQMAIENNIEWFKTSMIDAIRKEF